MKHRPQSTALFDDDAFEVLAVINGADRLAFLNHYFWKVPTVITRAHHVCSVLMLIVAAVMGSSRGFGLAAWVGTAAAGLTSAAVLLMPVHEAIHAAAYRALGAKDIRWALSLRNPMASVTAHRFVLSGREAMIVSALPWLVVTALLGLAVGFVASLRPFLLITLLGHHVGSRGDWAYLSYFWRCRRRELYVVEDADLEQSWFCVARHR